MSEPSVGASDVMKRLVVADPDGAGAIARALLGCQWGRRLATEGDKEPCPEQAVQITVIHVDEADTTGTAFKFCARHTEAIRTLTEDRTAPHE
jgi:hypothetical protein